MIAKPPDRRPDALLVPRPFRRLVGLQRPQSEINRLFGGIFGIKRFYCASLITQYYCRADPNTTLHFGVGHDLETEPCYDWFVVSPNDQTDPDVSKAEPVENHITRIETIRFGWFRDTDAIPVPTAIAKAQFNQEIAAFKDKVKGAVNRFLELEKKGFDKLTPGEVEEYNTLYKELS